MPRLPAFLVLLLLASRALGASSSVRKTTADCPRLWVRYERTKSCFHVIEQRLRWDEAEAYCARNGGHLASLIDEYENYFVYDVAKKSNLSNPTVWLGRLTRLTKTGAYEWHDGAIGRHSEGFKAPPSGTDRCLTMWLDFDGPERSWIEWDCGYATGYSGLCKKSFKNRPTQQTLQVSTPSLHQARRCCLSACPAAPLAHRCSSGERCIPDDLDCWTRSCANGAPGWCLPLPS